MQPPVFAGQQLIMDDLTQDGVPKRIVLFTHHHQSRLDGLPQAALNLALRLAGHGRQQVLIELHPCHRSDLQQVLSGVVERVESDEESFAEGGGEDAAPTGAARQFLREVGNALAPLDDPGDAGGTRVDEQLPDEIGDVIVRERIERDVGERAPMQLRNDRSQRMATGDLVGPIGHQHQHAALLLGAQRRDLQRSIEEAQQVARRDIGPVEILHDDGERPLARGAEQDIRDRLEHLRPLRLGHPAITPERRNQRTQRGMTRARPPPDLIGPMASDQ